MKSATVVSLSNTTNDTDRFIRPVLEPSLLCSPDVVDFISLFSRRCSHYCYVLYRVHLHLSRYVALYDVMDI